MKRSGKWRLAGLAATIGCLAGAPAAGADTLSISSYFGGSHHDQVGDVAVDSAGNVYVTGWTASADFPVRNPQFGFTGGVDEFECDDFGCADAFVAKFAPGGRSLIYSTYLAGSRLDEGTGIAVDAAGSAYVVGRTNSGDFPAGGDPQSLGGTGTFVVKLGPGGAPAWTRYVGRTSRYTDSDVAVGAGGHVYVTGATDDEFFETTPGAYDRQCVDPQYNDNCTDSFVARFTTSGAHLATTLFGGDFPDERAAAVAVDSAGRPVIAGAVGAPMYGFPRTPGSYGQTPEPSGRAAFVARLSADLARLEWAAAYGGRDGDHVLDLALDPQDRPVLVGWTDSRDYPTTPGALDRQCNASDEWYSCPGQPDGFATKMTADGSGLVWSTYIGGVGEDVAYSVALGPQGDVSLTGTTTHEDSFPLKDPYQAETPYNEASCRNRWYCDDSFFVRLSESGGLLYGSLLGGGSQDAGHGVAVDPEGDAWLGGVAYSSDFPVTSAMQPARAGGECPWWQYYDNPECSDGFLTEFGAAPAATPATSPAGSTSPATADVAAESSARDTRRLSVVRRGRRLSGRLTGDGCTAGARLVLERRARAGWRAVRRLRTRADGRFAVRLPARAGRYRLRAPATRACAAAGSRVLRAH